MPGPDSELATSAERELASFLRAVEVQFGPENAIQAADDWIEALRLFDWFESEVPSSWRPVTVAAAAALASRLVPERIAPWSEENL